MPVLSVGSGDNSGSIGLWVAVSLFGVALLGVIAAIIIKLIRNKQCKRLQHELDAECKAREEERAAKERELQALRAQLSAAEEDLKNLHEYVNELETIRDEAAKGFEGLRQENAKLRALQSGGRLSEELIAFLNEGTEQGRDKAEERLRTYAWMCVQWKDVSEKIAQLKKSDNPYVREQLIDDLSKLIRIYDRSRGGTNQ